MAAAALIPVAEYLATSYRPDCDYLESELRERKVGEKKRSRTQREILISEFHISDAPGAATQPVFAAGSSSAAGYSPNSAFR